jgi:type I restriction enzyme S subunit
MSWSKYTRRIIDVCKVIAGQSPEGKHYNKDGEGLPFYQGKKEFNDREIGKPTTWTKKTTKEAFAGDILMSVRAPVGPINLSTQHICIGRGLAAIRASEKVNRDYLFYYLLKHEAEIVGNTGAVFNSINKNQIGNISIPIPPIEEQKQIVEILDKAFTAIDHAKANIEKNIVNAKELFQSKLDYIFSQKGSGWEEKSLGEVCEMIKRGIAPKYADNQGLTIINQKCIRDHKINLEKSRKHNLILKKVSTEKLIRIGDVLVNSTGTGTLGRVAQVRDEEHVGCTVDTHVTIVRPVPNLFFIDFFGYAMIKIEDEITKSGEGASGQTELQRKKLQELFLISYPASHEMQKQLVITLDTLNIYTKKLINNYLIKINNIEELKKSILQKAFSGELTQKEVVV